MMRMSGRVTSCCVALFFALTSVSAVQRLDSIDDLKRINFGQSVPKHSLVLLYWFANTVDIDVNDNIWLNFDPNTGDYGSHHYGNFEEMLDPLPWGNGYRYYTLGGLSQDASRRLPTYVVRTPAGYNGTNRDRIIIRVRGQNAGLGGLPRIDQVYITQHCENLGTSYDPEHTYLITTNLLRQIRQFSLGQNQQEMLRLRDRHGSNADVFHIRNTWGHLACLGLLLFMVIQEPFNQHNNRPEHSYRQQSNYRPEFIFTPQSSYRPEYSFTPQSSYRPEYGSRLQTTNISQNTYSDWNDDALVACCCFVLVILGLLIFGFLYTLGK